MEKSHKFQLALITGASSGIGESLASLLADQGINLIIHGRDISRLENVADRLRSKVQVTILVADLAQADDRAKVVQCIHELQPDLVVNNAGFGMYGDALTHETSKQMDILMVDAAAVLEISLEAARTLVSFDKKGVVMNVSSAAAWPIFPAFAVYGACKAFVNQFSESFDEEVKHLGVRVLACCPGVVATGFRQIAGGGANRGDQMEPMSAEFAAQEIWNQIQSGQKIRIIDWRYRALIFLVRYIMPKCLVAKVIRKSVDDFFPPRNILKIK